MNSRRRNRLGSVIIVLAGAALTTALVLYALRSNIDLFYTPGEILHGKGKQQEKPQPGQRLRMGGIVMPGSLKRDADSLSITFKVCDARGVIAVDYQGILPDLFREGQSIVAQGIFVGGNRFHAREILAKHDENYTPPEVSEAMKANDQDPILAGSSEQHSEQNEDAQP